MLAGGILLVKGSYTETQKHEANIFGAELSVTEKDRKPIPKALSFTLLGVGAAVTVIGAMKSRKG
jgi:hypothetical protein